MKFPATIIRVLLAAGAAGLAGAAADARAQQGRATDFTITEYYEAPHQLQVKSILSGAEVVHRPGRPDVIKQFKLQTFYLDGKTNLVVTGPECFYDEKAYTASSAGPLLVQNGDGSFRVAGEGFLWRQTNSSLTISNQVRTVAENVTQLNLKP
jgi:hypothetical protein